MCRLPPAKQTLSEGKGTNRRGTLHELACLTGGDSPFRNTPCLIDRFVRRRRCAGCRHSDTAPNSKGERMRKIVGAVVVLAIFCGIALAEEIRAVITKVDGDKVTFFASKGKDDK